MTTDAIRAADHYRSLHQRNEIPDYESLLEQAYSKLIKPKQTVLDIGAHGGRHARPFAKLVGPYGRVICFEPLPREAEWLRQSFAESAHVQIREMALSRESGSAEFLHVRNAPEESGLRERIYNIADPDIERIQVAVSTLDREAEQLKRVDYVKIDIEGGEIDCLEGGRSTLRKHRPLVSIEYGHPSYSRYGNSWNTLFDTANSLDYKMGDLFGNLISSRSEWQNVCDKAYWDYFLVPQEKAEFWQSALREAPLPEKQSWLGKLRKLLT